MKILASRELNTDPVDGSLPDLTFVILLLRNPDEKKRDPLFPDWYDELGVERQLGTESPAHPGSYPIINRNKGKKEALLMVDNENLRLSLPRFRSKRAK